MLDSKWAKRHQDYISKRGRKGEKKHQVLMMQDKELLLIFLERNFCEPRLGRVLDRDLCGSPLENTHLSALRILTIGLYSLCLIEYI